MHHIFDQQPIFPIPPSYDINGNLDFEQIERYLTYLKSFGVRRVMTTAGTSQFNLLSLEEIRLFNAFVCETFSDHISQVILGMPALPIRQLRKEVEQLDRRLDDKLHYFYMFLYPERYYDDDTLVRFFTDASRLATRPSWLHGMFMRNGRGGTYNFTPEVVKKIVESGNFSGMKEEHQTFQGAYDMCKGLQDLKDFDVCVAGGDQRRFALCQPVGAKTFLTGVGSIVPTVDLMFEHNMVLGMSMTGRRILNEIHNPVYDAFKKIGWHRAMREALRLEKVCCRYDRDPWLPCTPEEQHVVRFAIRDAKRKISEIGEIR